MLSPFKNMYNVVVLDKQPVVSFAIKKLLDNHKLFNYIGSANSKFELSQLLTQQNVDILINEINVPDIDYMQFFKNSAKDYPQLKIILYTSYNYAKLFQNISQLKKLHGIVLKTSNLNILTEAMQSIVTNKNYFDQNISWTLNTYEEKQIIQLAKEEDSYISRFKITEREMDVLKLLAQGYSVKKIAIQLHISNSTVETHKKHIYKKLQLKNMAQLIRFAIKSGY